MAGESDFSWLQQMLQTIQESISETNRNVTVTNQNVTEAKQAIAALQQQVAAIANEQERLDEVLQKHEAEFREIRKDLGVIKDNANKAVELERKFSALETKHDDQAKQINELREWKLKREAAWSGPTVLIAGVASIFPILAMLYTAFEFIQKNI